jgi:hypothetical protein
MDFDKVYLTSAPSLPQHPILTTPSRSVKVEPAKTIRTKDILLHDDKVLRERRSGAFKNYTYRALDWTDILRRMADEE